MSKTKSCNLLGLDLSLNLSSSFWNAANILFLAISGLSTISGILTPHTYLFWVQVPYFLLLIILNFGTWLDTFHHICTIVYILFVSSDSVSWYIYNFQLPIAGLLLAHRINSLVMGMLAYACCVYLHLVVHYQALISEIRDGRVSPYDARYSWVAYGLGWYFILVVTTKVMDLINPTFIMFQVLGLRFGFRTQLVTDPAIAAAVLRASVDKGIGLEDRFAMRAWAPILSLESVNGPLWRSLRRDLNKLMSILPPISHLQSIAHNVASAEIQRGTVIDTKAMSRMSLTIFMQWLFNVQWDNTAHRPLLEGVEEWRREIACRGEGDQKKKRAACMVVCNLAMNSERFGTLFGDRQKWRELRYLSLFLQPFFISPAINVADIAVACKLPGVANISTASSKHPGLAEAFPSNSTKDIVARALHLYHPFPILERYVASPVSLKGQVVVRQNTHVVMLAGNLCSHSSASECLAFSSFGHGRRMCAGAHVAKAILYPLCSVLINSEQFKPQQGHQHSGRDNDDIPLHHLPYFLRLVATSIFGPDYVAKFVVLQGT